MNFNQVYAQLSELNRIHGNVSVVVKAQGTEDMFLSTSLIDFHNRATYLNIVSHDAVVIDCWNYSVGSFFCANLVNILVAMGNFTHCKNPRALDLETTKLLISPASFKYYTVKSIEWRPIPSEIYLHVETYDFPVVKFVNDK